MVLAILVRQGQLSSSNSTISTSTSTSTISTSTSTSTRSQLESTPGLVGRMAALMGVEALEGALGEEGEEGVSEEQVGELVEGVLRERWRFAQTYSTGGETAEERQPVGGVVWCGVH